MGKKSAGQFRVGTKKVGEGSCGKTANCTTLRLCLVAVCGIFTAYFFGSETNSAIYPVIARVLREMEGATGW